MHGYRENAQYSKKVLYKVLNFNIQESFSKLILIFERKEYMMKMCTGTKKDKY